MTPQDKPIPASLTETLLKNALESGLSERESVSLKLWQIWLWLRRNSVWLVGIVLTIVGVWGTWKCPNELGRKLCESFIVAGILSISVDVWLKRRLQEDAAKDIFHHLLGMSLPAELREHLQVVLEENTIYRPSITHRINVEDNGDSVTLSVEIDAVNKAAKDSEYCQSLMLEEAFNGHLQYASLRSVKDSHYVLTEKELNLAKDKPEPMVWSWEGPTVPLAKGEELHQHVRFTVKRARSDFYILFFGRPSINPTIRVTGSDTLFITASADSKTQVNGDEYVYKRVFLRGDHLQIRWKPKAPSN
jgi:hypothetical protein